MTASTASLMNNNELAMTNLMNTDEFAVAVNKDQLTICCRD